MKVEDILNVVDNMEVTLVDSDGNEWVPDACGNMDVLSVQPYSIGGGIIVLFEKD